MTSLLGFVLTECLYKQWLDLVSDHAFSVTFYYSQFRDGHKRSCLAAVLDVAHVFFD